MSFIHTLYLFCYLFCKYILHTFVPMITKATISLNDKVKKAGQQKATENAIRGGFSAYIESLIQKDLDNDNPMIFKERTFTEREIQALQSEVHSITGNGKVMQCFNALLGVVAGG